MAAPPAVSPLAFAVPDAQCAKDAVFPLANGALSVPSDLWSLTGQPTPF